MQNIVKALDILHSKSLIHLDIKLENIIIDTNMKNIKFIDYGCTQKLPDCQTDKKYIISTCGTSYYMSREMV